jgi:hypothetical protein
VSAHGTETNTEPLLFPDPVIEAYIKDVDRTLLRDALRWSMPERFEAVARLVKDAAEFRRQVKQTHGAH